MLRSKWPLMPTLLIVILVVGSCDQMKGLAGKPVPADRPQDATGDTPIRYVSCADITNTCVVTARFKDLESCDWYKTIWNSLCDSKSTPGLITCRTGQSTMSKGWCIP
jgi:hypothetical protein